METDKGIPIPDDVAARLQADPDVMAVFERMRPSCQREYVDWIEEAKRPQTRARRLEALGEKVLDYGRRHRWL